MASVLPDNSTDPTPAEEIRFRRSNKNPPNPQPTGCKPTISSLFLSTFTNGNNTNVSPPHRKKNFSSATFRGLGCATSAQVSAPAAIIRSSADWQAKKVRKKKHKKKNQQQAIPTAANTMSATPTPVVVVPDVWCTPGIGFAADATSVDCVVSRRPVQGRGRADGGERLNHRERSCTLRRVNNLEHMSLLESPSDFEAARFGSDVYGARHHRHFRHPSPEGLAEVLLFQMGDRYRAWRLDIDHMSYEQLLALGDKIGYVSTGLKEDEIVRCIRKTKEVTLDTLPSHYPVQMDPKCTICQEEYDGDDETGKLNCGHSYHTHCIKQWLLQKNACPVCKVAASV